MRNLHAAARFHPLITRIGALTLLAALSTIAFAEKRADLSRLVVVGDSLSAGFQNGSLLNVQQPHGYASLVANQARTTLPLPLIAAPGIPNVLTLVSPGPPPVIVPAPGSSTGRDDPFLQPMDLAVPGATVEDALTKRPTPAFTSITDVVLGLPGLLSGISRSQVEWAEHLAPTTVFVWLGNNDALGVVFTADPSILTPIAVFRAAYEDVTNRLAATGATLVVANIPDVTVIPYLTSSEKVAAQTGLPLYVVGPILGIGRGDFVIPDAFPLIAARLENPALGPLPAHVVLDSFEVITVRSTIRRYNEIIATQARMRNAALVDIHGLLTDIQRKGFVVGGQRLTTDFLGGIFSLDGIHPTNTGYAIVANAFVKEVNRRFEARIPPVSVEQIRKTDPLVPADRPHHQREGHVSSQAARTLRKVMVDREAQ
jgi:phospholipase/lecithinase/hemolysin